MEGQASITTGTVALLFKPHAIPSVEAATLQNFRAFRAFRGQKMGCGRQPTPSLFVWFVVNKIIFPRAFRGIAFRLLRRLPVPWPFPFFGHRYFRRQLAKSYFC